MPGVASGREIAERHCLGKRALGILMMRADRPLADFVGWRPDAFVTDGGCHALPHETFARLFRTAVVYVNTPPRRDSRKIAVTLRC